MAEFTLTPSAIAKAVERATAVSRGADGVLDENRFLEVLIHLLTGEPPPHHTSAEPPAPEPPGGENDFSIGEDDAIDFGGDPDGGGGSRGGV